MLLSSAKFELSSAGPEPVEIDVTKRVGVDLILPVASLLPLERRVQWEEKMEIPRKVLDTLADGADALGCGPDRRKGLGVDKLVAKLPKVGPFARAALPALIAAVKMAGSQLRQINEQARENHDYLTATLTQFKLDLDQGETDETAHQEQVVRPGEDLPERLIWATRGRSWGFRFLLKGGLSDPLLAYERSFADHEDEPATCRRAAGTVALRFPDPLGRRDASGRVIPHEFVVFGDLADEIESVEDGLHTSGPSLQRPMPESGTPKVLRNPCRRALRTFAFVATTRRNRLASTGAP